MKFQLIINFENFNELNEFICDQDSILDTKLKKTFKKVDDKRGSSTYILHQKAKEYQETHNDTPYKECLKIVGKTIKENKNKSIENFNNETI
jgi:hypothetical protein